MVGINPQEPIKKDIPVIDKEKNKSKDKSNEEVKTEKPQENNTDKDKNSITPSSKSETKAKTSISLGFDNSKPTAPDKNPDKDNRFNGLAREIFFPLVSTNSNKIDIVNPLLVSGIKTDSKGLVLTNIPATPALNFSMIDAPTQAVATLFDTLSKEFPNVEKNTLYRLAKVATYVAIDVPLMVASHELGHAGGAKDSCPSCNPNVQIHNWMSGLTQYNRPEGVSISDKERLFSSVAGMNQATYNGEEISRRMHTKGADISDAIQYLVNITNSANYQMKDWIKNSKAGTNDGATYHKMLEDRNKGWNQSNLSMLSVGVNLLNTDFWTSLIGSANYIITGKQIKMPEIKVGNYNFSLPSLSLINTYEGPQLNTSIYAHNGGKSTAELKYSTILTPDNGASMGIEGRLHNLYIPHTNDSLSVSPIVGVSTSNKELGFKVGTGINYRPMNNKYVSVSADFSYKTNYMPEVYMPNARNDGFSGILGVNLSLP